MDHSKPLRAVPEMSDEGRREFTAAMQIKVVGNLPVAAERFGACLGYYKKVIAEIYFQIGDCLYKQNDWDAAAEQFELALQTAPGHRRAEDRLSSCHNLVKRRANPEG